MIYLIIGHVVTKVRKEDILAIKKRIKQEEQNIKRVPPVRLAIC
jgi:hypothetical protein